MIWNWINKFDRYMDFGGAFAASLRDDWHLFEGETWSEKIERESFQRRFQIWFNDKKIN